METKVEKKDLFKYQMLIRSFDENGLMEKVANALTELKAAHKEDVVAVFAANPLKEYSDEQDQKAVKRLKRHIVAELNCYLCGWADEELKAPDEDFESYIYRRYMTALESAGKELREFKAPSEKAREKKEKEEKEKAERDKKEKRRKANAAKKAKTVANPISTAATEQPQKPEEKASEETHAFRDDKEKPETAAEAATEVLKNVEQAHEASTEEVLLSDTVVDKADEPAKSVTEPVTSEYMAEGFSNAVEEEFMALPF